jgi:hypothetical protein
MTVGVLLRILISLSHDFHWVRNTQEVEDALQWNYYGATLPQPALELWWYLDFALPCIGWYGFIWRKSWSRHVLLAWFLLGIVLAPTLGLSVAAAWQVAMGSASFIVIVVALTLSYTSPANKLFDGGPPSPSFAQLENES